MKKEVSRSVTLIVVLTITFSVTALAASLLQWQGAARSSDVNPAKQKKLREIASERDVEVEGISESRADYPTLESLRENATAVVYGQIIDSKSFFDESGHPIEYGEVITTEYTVDVLRVLKDKTPGAAPLPEQHPRAPLLTPLKIARNGGVVKVGGHRAAVNVKGYDLLKPGQQYVFFLSWSPDYKAYVLAGGISGAVRINDDLSLKPLATSEAIHSRLRGMNLESLIDQVKDHR